MTKHETRARAIADVTSGTILASIEIAASPERVFRAISSPEEIVRWWGSQAMYKTTKWDADFRVRGRWRWRSEGVGSDGVPFSVEGDPQGPWGLGLVRVQDESEVQSLQAGDPVIRSQRGFRYEILPMLSAVLPD